MHRITPFGNPGVNGYVLLSPAYRSLSRPSSPDSSQASAIDLYSLGHIIFSALSLKTRDLRVCTFSNQAVHNPSLKSFFYFQHTAEDIPVCFRPSFVISKNSRFVELPFSTFGMFFNIPEKEITDCVYCTQNTKIPFLKRR